MWTAMMFPSMAPVAILWARSIVHRSSSVVATYRIALFVTGYLLAWAFAGVLAFFGLALFEQVLVLVGNHAGWLGALSLSLRAFTDSRRSRTSVCGIVARR